MKRINEYKKLFQVTGEIDLNEIKKTYRNLVKEWHPDQFHNDEAKLQEAELKGTQIIDAYHFLISIAPATKASNLEEYNEVTIVSGIDDFKHKGLKLEVTFMNGAVYEYFGVSPNLYKKLINADNQLRFAKRNIFHSYLYRRAKKEVLQEA
ncbi:MAG: KTSC domain-containing protein [Bacteroidetes bacterium]|nr:MAG: KTSC domain-containing protein [Bacteroidota bacterium]MBL1144615.1 KTSC domain-containing protein [Bacteroidota bacterium]MCB0804083.1 KTSC domain-containing protein [Flavobacteriales bacterium]NOG57410.1 KTSC domain-containing protein [Bacteroidota bacterium]